jgi:transcriptional regulator with XRE-family HTH domain
VTEAEQIGHTLAANVRRLRTARNLSQGDLARKAGVNPSELSHIESRPGRGVYLTTVERIAGALGVSPTRLLLEPSCPHCGDTPPTGYSCLACHKWRAA